MKLRTGYLCGGINGLNDAQASDWRDQTIADISHVTWLNPMRRDYRGKEAESVNEIVEGDLDDLRRSDFVIANAMRPSWGTGMEIYHFAAVLNRPVISICDGVVSPWLRKHSLLIVPTLAEAHAVLKRM